jgi:hypothetical protein
VGGEGVREGGREGGRTCVYMHKRLVKKEERRVVLKRVFE